MSAENFADVFISYHTDSAREQVEKICAALEGAGVKCWYAPRDCRDAFGGTIVDAIRHTRVFLLVLNSKFNVSEHCLNELHAAFDRVSAHEDMTILPFRIDDCSLSDDAYYYIGRIHIMNGTLPPEVARLKELVDRIINILGRDPVSHIDVSLEPKSTESKKEYYIKSSLCYPDNHFVGRNKEIEAIHNGLNSAENVLFLVGMGGIGKSEAAKSYCVRYRDEYNTILWVSFDTSLKKTIADDFIFPVNGISRSDYPNEDENAYFQRKLSVIKSIADKNTLFVIDNFDVMEDPDLEAFYSGEYAVLFTTRNHNIDSHIPEVTVEKMTEPDELMALFKAEYSRNVADEQVEYIHRLFEVFDGHPLSIRLVASAMQSRRLSPEKMLNMLDSGMASMNTANAKAADIIYGNLKNVFALSSLHENELYILKNLALVPLGGIEVETFCEWCEYDEFDDIDELIRRSWIIHNPATDEIHLHPLVADIMTEQVKENPDDCSRYMTHLMGLHGHLKELLYNDYLQFMNYLKAAVNHLPADFAFAINAKRVLANVLFELSQYNSAIEICKEILPVVTNAKDKMFLLHKLSHTHCLIGDCKTSIEYAKQGLDFIGEKKSYDEITPEQKYARYAFYSRLTESYRTIEYENHEHIFENALKYGRLALDYAKRYTENPKHQTTEIGWAQFHIARTLFMRNGDGDMQECEELLLNSIELFESIDNKWSAAFSHETLGQVYMLKKDFDKAIEESRKAFDALLPSTGHDHVDIALNLLNRGNIYRASGDGDSAMDFYREAREILVKLRMTSLVGNVDKVMNSDLYSPEEMSVSIRF